MAFTYPQISDFKARFNRDFPYGTDPNNAVLDIDISNSFLDAETMFNPAIWTSQSAFTIAFLLLAAHNLVINIRNSSQGLNGQYSWAQNSKAVGPVNEGIEIPQRLKDNPDFMAYSKTNYGAKYLNMMWPYLCAPTFSVFHKTRS